MRVVYLTELKGKSYEEGKMLLEKSGYNITEYYDSKDSNISDGVMDIYFTLFNVSDHLMDKKTYTEYYNIVNQEEGDAPETIPIKAIWTDELEE